MRWLRPKATSARSGYGSPVRICRGRSMACAWSTSSAQTGKRPAPTRGGRSSQLRGSSNSCCRVTKPGAGDLQPAERRRLVAAGHVEVAGEADEREHGARVLHAVGVVDHRGRAEHERRRLGRRVEPRGRADLLRRDAGDALDALRVELPHVGAVLGEPLGVRGDEPGVVQALLEDDVRDAERQRAVGARPQLQVQVGPGGELRAPRVDDDQLDATVERVHEVAGGRRVGVEGVGAPDEQRSACCARRDRPSARRAGLNAIIVAVKQALDSVQKLGEPYCRARRCTNGRICLG